MSEMYALVWCDDMKMTCYEWTWMKHYAKAHNVTQAMTTDYHLTCEQGTKPRIKKRTTTTSTNHKLNWVDRENFMEPMKLGFAAKTFF